jgi:RluA family pseudouridine synthase
MSFQQKTYEAHQCTAQYRVENQDHDKRLDQFLKMYLGKLSRQFIKKKIFKGEIFIENRFSEEPLKPSTKVKSGQVVTMLTKNLPELSHEDIPEVEDTLPLFENDFFYIVNKPAFMTTHPTGRHLFNCATTHFAKLFNHPHALHSVHRLDRETSGLLILAKNPIGAQKMTQLFEEGKITKVYLLLAHKKIEHSEHNIHHKIEFPYLNKKRIGKSELGESKTRIMMETYPENSNQGKWAQTLFDKVLEFDKFVMLLAFPISGRQHQIRVHASEMGYPLVGEKLYGDDSEIFFRDKDKTLTQNDHDNLIMTRQALHAIGLKFNFLNSNLENEPKNEHFQSIEVISTIPNDFIDFINKYTKIDILNLELIITKKIKDILKKINKESTHKKVLMENHFFL